MLKKVKSLWARYWLRDAKFSSRYPDLERLYTVRDPWNLDDPREAIRFAGTNAIIRVQSPTCAELLELGCGEGAQTAHLRNVSKSVVGLDVSSTAVARAKKRYPGGEFHAGRAEDIGTIFIGRRFDVITACEVLYYSDDVATILDAMKAASNLIVVTSYSDRVERLRPHLSGEGWSRVDDIVAQDLRWEAYIWRA